MKVLYVHMAALGDGLMASPAFQLLKEQVPGLELHVLARTHVVKYFQSLPMVDRVIPFADQRWLNRKKLHLLPRAIPEVVRLLATLRREKYDACLQWRGQVVDSVLSCSTGARIRIAAVHPYHRKSPLPVERTPFLMTDLVNLADPYGHVIDAMLAPAARLAGGEGYAVPEMGLKMHFPLTPEGREETRKFLDENGLLPGRFATVSFSSKTDANVWPAARFAEVADALSQRHGLRVVLDGLAAHKDREEEIARAMRTPPVRSAGALGLEGIAGVIAASRLVVCFNSAPMHLASAFGTPVVVIGGRDGAATRPWKVPHEVVTRNPFFPNRHPVRSEWPKLIAQVEASEVVGAVERVMEQSADVPVEKEIHP